MDELYVALHYYCTVYSLVYPLTTATPNAKPPATIQSTLQLISSRSRLVITPVIQKTSIELQIEGEAKKDWRSIVVYITFAITVLLWMFDKL